MNKAHNPNALLLYRIVFAMVANTQMRKLGLVASSAKGGPSIVVGGRRPIYKMNC